MMIALHHTDESSTPIPHEKWEDVIVAKGYRALVFDCDGTLVESGEAHYRSFQEAALAQGQRIERSWYDERTGLDRISLLTEFKRTLSADFDLDTGVRDSIEAFEKHMHLVKAVPETAKLLTRLSPKYPIAVGTNAESVVAIASLTATGLIKLVRFVVGVSDGLRPKPFPDIFSTAAARLGYSNTEVLVIEDSRQGVEAARLAGMDVFEVIISD